jgi:DmsE family decaheme c-type cytochrome
MAADGFTDENAKACVDCHGDSKVLSILKTAHGNKDDRHTPAAQKWCQSCHGPSARHMQFPMQVDNLHFGKESRAKPEVQNEACLECHRGGARKNWSASAHGFENVVCSTCHHIHDPPRIVPRTATVSKGCQAAGCHDELMAGAKEGEFSHAVDKALQDGEQLTCAGCHNPHGPLSSDRCVDCHAQTPEAVAKQSEKARRYHEVARQKGTACMRCHKELSHPIKPLDLQEAKVGAGAAR